MGGVADTIKNAVGSFNPTSADPSGGLSGGQMFARKAAAGALSGAGNALNAQQNGGAPQPVDFSKLGGNVRPAPPKMPYQVSSGEVPQIPTPSSLNPSGMPSKKLYQDDGSEEY